VSATLEALRLDPTRWRLVDVRPPVRALEFARGAAPVPVTRDRLVRDTLGLRHRFVSEGETRHFVTRGMPRPFAVRFESDASTIYLLYRYGAHHGDVRIEHRGSERFLPVDWALPGEPGLDEVLRSARSLGSEVVLVLRPPRELLDWPCIPVRCRIVDVGPTVAAIEPDIGEFTVPRWRICVASLAGGRTDQ
jgi:hypothetical protein